MPFSWLFLGLAGLLLGSGMRGGAVAAFPSASFFKTNTNYKLGRALLLPSSDSSLWMARPGQSEAQERQERENEIRLAISKLKSAGRLHKGGSDGSESMMNEAEAFFNQESPTRKFERRQRERKEREQAEKESKEAQQGIPEDADDLSDSNVA